MVLRKLEKKKRVKRKRTSIARPITIGVFEQEADGSGKSGKEKNNTYMYIEGR